MTRRHDLKDINLRLLDDIDRLAAQYGLPKLAKHSARERRYGEGHNPGLVIYTDSARAGRWYDHKAAEGGSLIDLIGRETGQSDFGSALREALSFLGLVGEAPQEPDPEVLARRRQQALDDQAEMDRRYADDLDLALDFWRAAVPIEGTLAETYLRGRGLDMSTPSGRFHPEIPFQRERPDRGSGPCLLWAVAGEDRRIIGIQRVWLRALPDGRVIRNPDRPRMLLGRQLRGAIRLTPVTGHLLGLAEGAETAASAVQMFGVPCWAAVTRTNFAELPIPPGVRELILFGDADEADLQQKIMNGQELSHPAAVHLAACVARRAEDVRQGRLDRIWLSIPDGDDGRDWNNVLMEERR